MANSSNDKLQLNGLQVKEAIAEVDPILASKMVPECLYRGFCPEFMNPCGYSKTEKYKKDLEEYRSV